MNASKKRKFVWWSHGANATRSTATFFSNCFDDFWNYESNQPAIVGTHDFGIPKGCEDFIILSNVRNPYTLIVSVYRDFVDERMRQGIEMPDFKDWVYTETKDSLDSADDSRWQNAGRIPDVFIHMETLEKDLTNLSFVKEWLDEDEKNNDILENSLNHCIRTNHFMGESSGDKYKNGFQDISNIYDQDTANQVVRLYGGEHYFNKIGYDIDSWKY